MAKVSKSTGSCDFCLSDEGLIVMVQDGEMELDYCPKCLLRDIALYKKAEMFLLMEFSKMEKDQWAL